MYSRYDTNIKPSLKSMLNSLGYLISKKITNTLQGSIWRAVDCRTNEQIVIKITDRHLHSNSMIMINGKKCEVNENILKEKCILKYLSKDANCPKSIVKYIDCLKSNAHYFLFMEDGGFSLFDFVVKAHRLISIGHFSIKEWHKMCKTIFIQMLECIEYIHSKGVCHFDISLENMLINDVDVILHDNKLEFNHETVQIKLCDFGLGEIFPYDKSNKNTFNFKSNKYCGKTNYKCPEITARKKYFDAKSNDLWCVSVCLFMMVLGTAPFRTTYMNDSSFEVVINGDINLLIKVWDKEKYVNKELIDLFQSIFVFEEKRINLQQIKQSKWLKK